MMDFLINERGAVTVDWVALAAGLLIFSVGAAGLLTTEVQVIVDEIEFLYTQADQFNLPS
ncbi:MAG: hypothetical protein AAF899_04300 [Pseudomonadota bacterium]